MTSARLGKRLTILVFMFILFAGCASQPHLEEPKTLDVKPVVDYYFLAEYTGNSGEGFYVVAGDVKEVKGALMEILAGKAPRTTFSEDESLNLVVFRGVFSTGGHGIKINRVERVGNTFIVHATFTDPGKGTIVTQAFTQPTAVIPLGKLPAGGYSAELYVNKVVSGEGKEVIEEEKLHKRIEFVVE
jgi:hypothetical protein